jgi:hypothetical protein
MEGGYSPMNVVSLQGWYCISPVKDRAGTTVSGMPAMIGAGLRGRVSGSRFFAFADKISTR